MRTGKFQVEEGKIQIYFFHSWTIKDKINKLSASHKIKEILVKEEEGIHREISKI